MFDSIIHGGENRLNSQSGENRLDHSQWRCMYSYENQLDHSHHSQSEFANVTGPAHAH